MNDIDKKFPDIIGVDKDRIVGCKENDLIDGAFKFIEASGHSFPHNFWVYVPERVLFIGNNFGFGYKEVNCCPMLCTAPP